MKSITILSTIVIIGAVGIPVSMGYGAEENLIPNWFKMSLQTYLDGDTSDAELIASLEFLAKMGIIHIEQKKYDPFSLEKFPDTGGFNPDWLDGEREKILDSCQEQKTVGFENAYCQYVQ